MIRAKDADEKAALLISAMPMTSSYVDMVQRLAASYESFEPIAREAAAWYEQKTKLAKDALDTLMYMNGSESEILQLTSVDSHERHDRRQSIGMTIVEGIPADNDGTSDIETSLAYVHGANADRVTYDLLVGYMRTFLGDSHFTFADPRFGFGADFEAGEYRHTRCLVTIVDTNLPDGRLVVNLSGPEFTHEYDEMRQLCRTIQIEKNRRTAKPQREFARPTLSWLFGNNPAA